MTGANAVDASGRHKAWVALLALVHGATILVVDDDPFLREVTGLLLEDLRARVVLACDGADALSRLDAEAPDLILCDLMMPEMDGYQVVERLRCEPVRAWVPVIAVSARATPADRMQTSQAGFDAHLGKPFDYADLREVFAVVMRRHPTLYARQRERLRTFATQERLRARELRRVSKTARESGKKQVSDAKFKDVAAGSKKLDDCICGVPFPEMVLECADCAGRCCPACAFRWDGAVYCLTCADRRLAA